jgi:hypothetical protein
VERRPNLYFWSERQNSLIKWGGWPAAGVELTNQHLHEVELTQKKQPSQRTVKPFTGVQAL